MNLNFVVMEMTCLRHFIPIVIEGNKRGLKSVFYVGQSNKYNSPHKHVKCLKKLCNDFEIDRKQIGALANQKDVTFFIESVGLNYAKKASKKISITFGIDFQYGDDYVDNVDHIVIPNRFIAEHYNFCHDKNLYSGCPSFDISLDKQSIIDKYKLNDRFALIIFPKLDFMKKVDLKRLYGYLGEMGYDIVVKSRGKDVVPFGLRGDLYLEDASWYPHTTMELIYVVPDVIVNFNSFAAVECAMLGAPFINFDIKPIKPYPFLFEQNYCVELPPNVGETEFIKAANYLADSDFVETFIEMKKKYLFEGKGVAKKIIDAII